MVRLPAHRPPTHPGEFLADILSELELSQTELAKLIDVPIQRVNLIINRKRGVTPDTALRLARLFDMTPDFWLNAQLAWDLWHAEQEARPHVRRIHPLKRVG